MRNINNRQLYIEILWWLIALLVPLIFLAPIYFYKINYPFYLSNYIFIAVCITLLRWLFLWPITPYARLQYLKAAIILSSAIAVFYLIIYFSEFRIYLEDIGLQDMLQHIETHNQDQMEAYIRTQMIFFSVSSIICGFCLPFRMLSSIWTQHNRGYA